MTDIHVSLPGGEAISFPSSTSVQDAFAKLMSGKQRKLAVAAVLDGQKVDLSTLLMKDAVISPILIDSEIGVEVLRHSAAHVMALAVRDIFGVDVKVAIGPAIEDGFYYDFFCSQTFSPDDFEKIEARMAEIGRQSLPFVRTELSGAEALENFKKQGEKYKVELIQDLGAETVSTYQLGDFTDLCRGPHLPNTSWLKAFKLLRVAGAYWRGNEKKMFYSAFMALPSPMKRL